MSPNDNALLTPPEMDLADRAAIAAGTSGVTLMQAAGRAVAQAVRERWSKRAVLVLCGPGNNGGDGFVAARELRIAGWPVTVGLLGDRCQLTGDAAHHAALWDGQIQAACPELLGHADLLIDALFGAGLSRPLHDSALVLVQAMAKRNIPICAVDMPSGLDGVTGQVLGAAPPADLTVTFFRKKPAHLLLPGKALCGKLVVADIGIPASSLDGLGVAAYENGPELWLSSYPWPREQAHKYQRGHVLVLGGELMTGAARLAAMAAARAGAGLVTVAAPVAAWQVYASALVSVMVEPFDGMSGFATLLADHRKNVILVGPGAGRSDATRRFALAALGTRRSVVLDADAISVFASDPAQLFCAVQGPVVLTPHEGEFDRVFSDDGSKPERARRAARQSGAVLVLKGSDTVIAAPDGRLVINANAPPDLATGGTGDVLAGLVAGLMAQGLDAFNAAACACWLHGAAAQRFGPGLISQDLPDMLPHVLRGLKRLMGKQYRHRH